MAVPTTRQTFREYILRRLGSPVICVNISDEQIEDRIDDALTMYRLWHFDASERMLYSHKLTATDKTNKYITLPERIYGVSRLLPLSAHDWGSFFGFRYQFMLNEVAFAPNFDLLPYYMVMTHINQLEDFFEQKAFLRFNRNTNLLHIDTNWTLLDVDSYIVLDCQAFLDPNQLPDVWSDPWLLAYAAALAMRQWGENLSKYQNVQMLGGATFNGEQIISRAQADIEKLELQLKQNYHMPPLDFMAS